MPSQPCTLVVLVAQLGRIALKDRVYLAVGQAPEMRSVQPSLNPQTEQAEWA